jgi:hypothetical protein
MYCIAAVCISGCLSIIYQGESHPRVSITCTPYPIPNLSDVAPWEEEVVVAPDTLVSGGSFVVSVMGTTAMGPASYALNPPHLYILRFFKFSVSLLREYEPPLSLVP